MYVILNSVPTAINITFTMQPGDLQVQEGNAFRLRWDTWPHRYTCYMPCVHYCTLFVWPLVYWCTYRCSCNISVVEGDADNITSHFYWEKDGEFLRNGSEWVYIYYIVNSFIFTINCTDGYRRCCMCCLPLPYIATYVLMCINTWAFTVPFAG